MLGLLLASHALANGSPTQGSRSLTPKARPLLAAPRDHQKNEACNRELKGVGRRPDDVRSPRVRRCARRRGSTNQEFDRLGLGCGSPPRGHTSLSAGCLTASLAVSLVPGCRSTKWVR